MSYSLHNKDISFFYTFGRPLKVCGEGKVCEEDLDVSYDAGKGRAWAEEYDGLEFEKGITEVGPGFLDAFRGLKYLVIPYTLKSIGVTPALKALLQERDVLVRGWYDSFGERFAQENGLRFRQADILVGAVPGREYHSGTSLEFRFDEEGTPYCFFDEGCQGWAASNSGGGTRKQALEEDFFVGQTVESLAECLPYFRNVILENEDVRYFLETFNRRCGNLR